MIFVFLACSSMLKSTDVAPMETHWTHSDLVQAGNTHASAFLLKSDKDGLTLIDSGSTLEDNSMVKYLEEQGKSPLEVRKIFLTHGHNSHVTGLPLFPNAQIYALAEEEEHLKEKGVIVDQLLRDGQIIELGNSSLEVFLVSGHTGGNAAYRFDDLLIMGDSAVSLSDGSMVAVTGNADSPELAEASLEALGARLSGRSSEFSYTLFSHSGPLEGIDALLSYRAP